MIRFSAFYPAGPDTTFDHEYYAGRHAPMVIERLAPLGMRRAEITRGTDAIGDVAFAAVGHLYFDSLEDFERAWAKHGEEIVADIPNFTNVEPLAQVADVAASWSG